MSDAAIHCRDLRKHYPDVKAVDGLDLVIRRGECFGLLGPNGAGKTTTIEILEGLTEADGGDVEILDMRWSGHARELRERIGISLQETQFTDKLTVFETLTLFRSFYREGHDPEELLRTLSLDEKRTSRVGKLSGGQKQRLAVACALIGKPDILFLDEPTTGLDPQSRLQLWEVVTKFRSGGGTVLLTTHYMDEAERLCDRVAIIDHGRKIAEGAPRDLVAQHIEPQVVEVYGEGAESWAERFGRGASERCERTGETVFCYAHDADAIVHELEAENGLRFLHRRANLEDVFLKLTGRELRD